MVDQTQKTKVFHPFLNYPIIINVGLNIFYVSLKVYMYINIKYQLAHHK